MSVIKSSLLSGVDTLFVPDNRFKTTAISVNFYMPLKREYISKYALLSALLTSSSKNYPDYAELNKKLSSLYGAELSSSVTKAGDNLCLKFYASTINNAYALENEQPLVDLANLLLELVFNPKAENGKFCSEDVAREKRKLIEHIKGELNEKRTYARGRMLAEMFEGDPYGAYRYGDVESVEKVSESDLFTAWQNMLKFAYIRIHTVGEDLGKAYYDNIVDQLSKYGRNCLGINPTAALAVRGTVKEVVEPMDIAQGKLCLGFSCKGGSVDNMSLKVMCDIFGGGPYSKLFNHVREEQSLCYYCAASASQIKGYIMVDCGVEWENTEKARSEILNQLNEIKNGNISDFEFNSSLKSISDHLKTSTDNAAAIDAWYTAYAVYSDIPSPEDLRGYLKNVTKETVVAAAQTVELNTVYSLCPKEKAEV